MDKNGSVTFKDWNKGMVKHPTIALSLQGKNKGKYVTIVDENNLEILSKHRWYFSGNGYAMRDERKDGKRKAVLMHREIMKCPEDMDVDHINGDTLDNRKENLRICTTKQNTSSQKIQSRKKSSLYKGVDFYTVYSKWRAGIKNNGKRIHLGYFSDEVEAAKQYDAMAIKLFGSFAKTNF